MGRTQSTDAERARLAQDTKREVNWKRWGPYLPDRQWGTVREDYSADGTCWDFFSHDQARSRAYRWGEDGLLGWTDRQCRICFAPAVWNGRDPFLKERLFGLTGPEGSHGEDVKEEYFFLAATPTNSYCKALYKYPQRPFPYRELVEANRGRPKELGEFELADTGVFDGNRYFDVFVEYAKAGPNDILIEITVANRYDQAAPIHLVPAVWFRNTWTWGRRHEACTIKPWIVAEDSFRMRLEHETLGRFYFDIDPETRPDYVDLLFTENDSNFERLFGTPNATRYTKDAFHDYVTKGKRDCVNREATGTKAAPYFRRLMGPGEIRRFRMRLYREDAGVSDNPFGGFTGIKSTRIAEYHAFYNSSLPSDLDPHHRETCLQSYAGLLWSKQFYHYIVDDWLEGDPDMPPPPDSRKHGRNHKWRHLYSRDVLSMPDRWEYPWFAAWDLAFHMIPFARVDPQFAKGQLILLLREWYMHPNGQIPAYEFAFGDVNPPVHAWAAVRVYQMEKEETGLGDRIFLESVFQKLLLNFTWWVNRKDESGQNLFSGGFLGLDNIGVFDRSKPLPTGGALQQADGTAWMAFYCSSMLSIALELAWDGENVHPAYEDMASKFLEHFIQIIDAINAEGQVGLWDDDDGFYYDHIDFGSHRETLRTRSMVGLIPLIATQVIDEDVVSRLHGFKRRTEWFLKNRPHLARHISFRPGAKQRWMLALTSRERLIRVLNYLCDEQEFLSPFGIRSLSKYHQRHPFVLEVDGHPHTVTYQAGESTTWLFGGNSNWRGPIWFPVNYILIESLLTYHEFYGDRLRVSFPSGSGETRNLKDIAEEIGARLIRLFEPRPDAPAPFAGKDRRFVENSGWKPYRWFHEYFHAESGRGLGASHQTGWTALVATLMENLCREKVRPKGFYDLPDLDTREAEDQERAKECSQEPEALSDPGASESLDDVETALSVEDEAKSDVARERSPLPKGDEVAQAKAKSTAKSNQRNPAE